MNPKRTSGGGLFIVIEGTDGSGKGTQFTLLADRLAQDGYDVEVFDFPQYDKESSYFVKRYLNGSYGSADTVGPYTGSLFYALDRYDTSDAIRQALAQGKIVLANRFTASNMAHQGTKFDDSEQRRGYYIWLDNLEFETLRIPRPDMNVVLRVPAETAQKLVDQKAPRGYTDKQRDIHEADLSHLQRAVSVYDELCHLFPKDFSQIDCVRQSALLDIDAIQQLLIEKIRPLLPPPGKKRHADSKALIPSTAKLVKPHIRADSDNPYVKKHGQHTTISEQGKQYLAQAVTDTSGPVYAFTDTFSPVAIAAAMARLSRRGDDMRLILLDEFAHAIGNDAQLLHRVITAYGDDSVQQLVGIPVVVEDASNLLTKKLEWGRLASYLEQSTRYIFYDQKDKHGQYQYVVPSSLDKAGRKVYRQAMDRIFTNYSTMVRQLTEFVRERSTVPESERDAAWKGATRAQACDAARAVLPVAAKSTVGVYASGQALENLIMHLLADELEEARITGKRLLHEARKVIPAFLERADKPERGGATVAYLANTRASVQELAETYLPTQHTVSDVKAVTMTDVWPRNELDIVADILYEHSAMPLRELRDIVDTWKYGQKADVLTTYMGERLNRRHRPGRALEKIHYSWDLVCDYGIFRDLQRHRMVDDLEWQQLTPRLGYDTPELIEQAGLSDMYDECFDISLQLHSYMQQHSGAVEAQYATLLGHKMRWKITYNAREAFHMHELRTSPQGHPGYRKLVGQMHDQLAQVHPLLADTMKFVNRDEDPELTRLAAERYTQYKLEKLDNQRNG